MKVISIVLAVLLVPATSLAQVNRCTVDGKTVYQEVPCPSTGSTVDLSGAGKADARSQGANYWRRKAQEMKADQRTVNAIGNREVFIGMDAQSVEMSWGKPKTKNVTLTAGEKREQWVYRKGRITQYVYLENSRVTTIQSPED